MERDSWHWGVFGGDVEIRSSGNFLGSMKVKLMRTPISGEY